LPIIQNVIVKRPVVGPLITIPETENRNPSPFKKFKIEESKPFTFFGTIIDGGKPLSYTITKKTCELIWKECGFYTTINEIGNPLALRFTCQNKSTIDVQTVSHGSLQSCQFRFPPISPLEAFLGKRWIDRGTSSTKYYYGRWIELID